MVRQYCVTVGLSLKVKQEQEKVAECERFLLLAEKENIEKFKKQKQSQQAEEVIRSAQLSS